MQDPKAMVILLHFPYALFLDFYSLLHSSEYEWSFHLIINELTNTSLQSHLLWFKRQHCRRFHHHPRSTKSSSIWRRRPPIRWTKWPSSQTMSWSSSLATSPPAPYAAVSVSVARGIASSRDLSIIRSYPRFSPDSSTATRNANATSLASMVNSPPCPSCPSPFRMSWSQIAPKASSSAGTLGFAMLSIIQWLRNYCYCRVATILVVQPAWGSI
jgi:hypothetical protein